MRVLLDECLPERLRDELPGHQVGTARAAGLAGKKDGVLLDFACAYFDVLVTLDQGLSASQQLARRNLGVILLQAPSGSFASLSPLLPRLRQALTTMTAGQVLRLEI